MQFHVPDPEYTGSPRAIRSFWLAIRLMVAALVAIWLVFALDVLLPVELTGYGLRPREGIGLLGLVTTPFLHGNLNHLVSNSLPLFVGGVAMLFIYPSAALRALPVIFLGSSALAWLFARPSVHIGASGLVYGMLVFVFVSGILRRDLRSVGVSMMVWLLYGSMIWGVLPGAQGTSWELHLSGALIGLIMAFALKPLDRPPIKRYDWEDDDDGDGDDVVGADDPSASRQPWRDWQ